MVAVFVCDEVPYHQLKYQKRLYSFFEYIGLPGTIEEQARLFARMGSRDSNWAFNNILKFMKHELERVNWKEITPGTLARCRFILSLNFRELR
jgi:hypothetical protein